MAADDIYKIHLNLEGPTMAASTGFYYREAIDRDGVLNDTRTLVEAWEGALIDAFLDILASDWKCTSITCRKMINDPVEKARFENAVQVGTVVGPSLPANNALILGLRQGTFPARQDGRVFIPGLAESATATGVITTAYQTGVVATFTGILVQQLVQLSAGSGRWDLGIISAKVLNAAPPFKDWDGAFAPVTSITSVPIIGTQRRRQTKVRGRSL